MEVFHFAEFGIKVYPPSNLLSIRIQWTSALSSEKADPVIIHSLKVMPS